jgi:hypothetical protein
MSCCLVVCLSLHNLSISLSVRLHNCLSFNHCACLFVCLSVSFSLGSSSCYCRSMSADDNGIDVDGQSPDSKLLGKVEIYLGLWSFFFFFRLPIVSVLNLYSPLSFLSCSLAKIYRVLSFVLSRLMLFFVALSCLFSSFLVLVLLSRCLRLSLSRGGVFV